jgi:hypothetical protein
MAFPLAVASLVGTGVGTIAQYQGQKRMAKTTRTVAAYNARVQENEAIQADLEAREGIRRQRVADRAFAGDVRTRVAASGVTTAGSPLEVMVNNATAMELRIQDEARRAESARRAGGARAQATRYEGAQIAKGYDISAFGTIMSGAAKLAGAGYNFYDSGAFS